MTFHIKYFTTTLPAHSVECRDSSINEASKIDIQYMPDRYIVKFPYFLQGLSNTGIVDPNINISKPLTGKES